MRQDSWESGSRREPHISLDREQTQTTGRERVRSERALVRMAVCLILNPLCQETKGTGRESDGGLVAVCLIFNHDSLDRERRRTGPRARSEGRSRGTFEKGNSRGTFEKAIHEGRSSRQLTRDVREKASCRRRSRNGLLAVFGRSIPPSRSRSRRSWWTPRKP